MSQPSATAGSVSDEVDTLIARYEKSRNRWALGYYVARSSTILLAASIPIMTTVASLPRVLIAVTGGLIVVIEGVSRLFGFHERYIAARVLYKSLGKERLLFQAGVEPYNDMADVHQREILLTSNLVRLLDRYDTQVFDVLTRTDDTQRPVDKKPAETTQPSLEASKEMNPGQ